MKNKYNIVLLFLSPMVVLILLIFMENPEPVTIKTVELASPKFETLHFDKGFLFCPTRNETLFYGEIKSPMIIQDNKIWVFTGIDNLNHVVIGDCHLEMDIN